MPDNKHADVVANPATLDDQRNSDFIAKVTAAFASREAATIDEVVAMAARLTELLSGDTAPTAPAKQTALTAVQTRAPVVKPAIPIEDAVTDEKVYCLICGRGFTMLKRHLKAEHGLSEAEYRLMFGLPDDFPLVAPAYSRRKAEYARKAGLGKYNRESGAGAGARTFG